MLGASWEELDWVSSSTWIEKGQRFKEVVVMTDKMFVRYHKVTKKSDLKVHGEA